MQFSFFFWYLPDLPYSRELCIKCRSCYRGIHSDCLTKEECDLLDSDGICCSACISSKKKRALTFPSNSQRPPLSQSLRKMIVCDSLHCSEQGQFQPGSQQLKRPKLPQSKKAQQTQRKRQIDKIFSQEQNSATKHRSNSVESDAETNSDIEFEVGGTVRCGRYKILYMCVSIKFQEEIVMLLYFFPLYQ